MSESEPIDNEIQAMADIYDSLANLDEAAQLRVLEYVTKRLGISLQGIGPDSERQERRSPPPPRDQSKTDELADADEGEDEDNDGDDDSSALEGISPVAKKWMRRNSLSEQQLSAIFSLGTEEIDLVAESVPGKNKRARSKEVLLLLGIAKYLSGGAARFTHAEAKEACIHYDAYDRANFAAGVKKFSGEITGSASEGYQLNARGITAATKLIKQMTNSD